MITAKQLTIFEVFGQKPFTEFTRKEVKSLAKEKSNNALARALNTWIKEGILLEKKVGKSGLLTLNLNNPISFYYLALSNHNKLSKPVQISLETIKQELQNCTPFYSIVIFGSYAEGKQKQSSDLDVAIFIENDEKKKRIEAALNSAKLKTPLEIDGHIITFSEMLQMLTEKQENLGKQIIRKHLVVHNHYLFYDIIKEGMNRGFRV